MAWQLVLRNGLDEILDETFTVMPYKKKGGGHESFPMVYSKADYALSKATSLEGKTESKKVLVILSDKTLFANKPQLPFRYGVQ